MTTLRRRMFVFVGGLVAALGTASLYFGTLFMFRQARDLETGVVRQNGVRARRLLENEFEHLDRFVQDWAFWDDTYTFVERKNPDYKKSNLVPDTYKTAGIHFMIFVSRAGELVYSGAWDEESNDLRPVSESLASFLQTNNLLKGFETSDDFRRGFLMADGEMYLVAARSILTSEKTGPSHGVLVMGRRFSDQHWVSVASNLLVDLTVYQPRDGDAYEQRANRLLSLREDFPVVVSRPDWKRICGCFLLRDMVMQPMAVVELSMPRRMFMATVRNVALFSLILLALCGVAVGGAVGGLNHIVLSRTLQLHEFVTALRNTDTISARVSVGGEDEIAALAEAVNLLLDKLQSTMDNLQRAELDLREQQTFLRQIVDAHPGYVWVKDEQHRFVLVNRGLADFCQTTPEQMIGKLDSDFNPDRMEVERFHREDEEVRRTGQPMVVPEEKITALSGAHVWISTYKVPLLDRDGRCRRILAVAVDISELKRGQEALRQSEARYRRLYENAPVAILLWDKDGRVLGWNPFAEKLFGWQRHELLWRNWIDLLLPPAEQQNMIKIQHTLIAGGAPLTMVTPAIAKSGALLTCEWRHAAISDDQGGFIAGLSFAHDITEQKRIEEQQRRLEFQMQQAQKLESLGVLAGGIAHDFNNILMAILGNADLALAELPGDSPVRTTMEEIILGSRRASDLCRQLLAYSGHGRFVIEPLNVSHLVAEMARMMEVAISKKVLLRVECPESLPAIEADATQIRQVVMNLLLNASEAIGQRSGVIAVRTGVKECSREFLDRTLLGQRLKPGLYVTLEVADTGCGMDPDTMRRIFEPFFTTKFTGRGLGLSAVLGIVRSHEGTLEVESEPGKGSTFRIYFPVSDKAWKQQDAEKTIPWRGSGTVLVVDDEDTVRALATRMLERCGFKVLQAKDGREAMTLLSENLHDVTAILLDLTMPHMDGHETLAEIRKLSASLPVVLSSGYSEQDLAKRFGNISNVVFLEKPYTRASLIAAFRNLLHM